MLNIFLMRFHRLAQIYLFILVSEFEFIVYIQLIGYVNASWTF